MKTCRKCGQVKPRTAFARDADRLDHRRSYCQQCDRIYALRAAARRRAAVAAATVNAEAAPSAEP